ncbi:MAG TPA: DUF4124 domain-containing protein, partial [Burkholderiales bacterium]|nr:DUF4124 domain-containing protein [Burkholderiales bacterium]
SLAAQGADVFRWVDEDGKVHYGESVPDRYKQKARKVDLTGTGVTDARRQEAEARLAKEKASAESLQRKREVKTDAEQAAPPPPDTRQAGNECEEQLKKYMDSQNCFAPYVMKDGAVRPEAFQQCTVVKQPRGCWPVSPPSDRKYDMPTLPRSGPEP